ncbi:MAG: hypothetical protein J7M40_14105 [Planctomycetes bacterium]|nr:hypothetical protein [Planctomycetota bacterium]
MSEMTLTLKGLLDVVSLSDEPVAVQLGFGRVGLSKVRLDDAPAPLGYDKSGRLILILTAKGSHRLAVEGTARLDELADGGMQFGMSLPEATAGSMKLRLPGDLEVHATTPVAKRAYDKAGDTTDVTLTVGGKANLTVVLMGNGRQDDDRAILLGESAASVQLTRKQQTLGCLFTVQVLRRGVRELGFEVPAEWTITDVTCPSLVKWSVDEDAALKTKTLTVRLRSAKTGTVALHIKALAELRQGLWQGPRVVLKDASFQRGYLLVSTDKAIGVRREKLTRARRADVAATAQIAGLVGLSAGQLYFHWGDDWSVALEPEEIELYRTVKGKQHLEVLGEEIRLTGAFEVTAVDREMYDMSFGIAGAERGWHIEKVTVDGKETGFEYRTETAPDEDVLRIELARPVRPEKVANVTVVLQHVPDDWQWDDVESTRKIVVPLIESRGRNVSGLVSVAAMGDLDISDPNATNDLEIVPVGRMAGLGISQNARYAWSYTAAARGRLTMNISRRLARVSARSVGLIDARPDGITGHWRITYTISRASARKLYLLADRSLGRKIDIQSQTVRLTSKNIVAPGADTIVLTDEIARRYNLWLLDLDDKRLGNVVVDASYERPLKEESVAAELIRPICAGGTDEQLLSEQLAIQASEQLAMDITADGAKEMDAVDLDPLPVAAGRILSAWRLAGAAANEQKDASFKLETKVHENYPIPVALAMSSRLRTYMDVSGGQRTEGVFSVANAGMQFLTIRLPKDAELWSLSVAGVQVKPQRSAGGDYQVSIGRSRQRVQVKLVYACQPAAAGLDKLQLGGVQLVGVQTNESRWEVYPPPGYAVVDQQTSMEMTGRVHPKPAFVSLWNSLHRPFASVVCGTTLGGGTAAPSDAGRLYSLAEQTADPMSIKEDIVLAETESRPREAAARPQKPPSRKPSSKVQTGLQQQSLGRQVRARGRYTLPVEIASPASGRIATFTCLGEADLIVKMKKEGLMTSWGKVGFWLVVFAGVAMLRRCVRMRLLFIAALFCISSLVAVWMAGLAPFANGAFIGGLVLMGLYPALWLVRIVGRWLRLCEPAAARTAVAATLLACMILSSSSAQAARSVQPNAPAPVQSRAVEPVFSSVIIPYEGSAAAAKETGKILLPYSRYVELWNKAHPDDPIDKPQPGSEISLAGVRYDATVSKDRFELVLTARVETYGRQWVTLPMPFSGVAVTEAKFDGKPANLQSGPKGMFLMLPGGVKGALEIKAVCEPKRIGRKGSVKFAVAPLPGAVMNVLLDEPGLQLEADGVDGTLRQEASTWIVPLSMKRDVSLRWQPKVPDSAADRTLSAESNHDVYIFHWAVVGVSKIKYSFSGGRHERFHLLLPEKMMLTDLSGANLRDVRQVRTRSVEGHSFKVLEVNLHRPARKSYEMTVRWLGDLSLLDEAHRLLLVRADGVGRESGTVTLHAAGGMTVKVANVQGGRRTALAATKQSAAKAHSATAVAKYYWPYRPFALFIQVTRPMITPAVALDQLVRIDRDKVQLLVQAKLNTKKGQLFGAAFDLPDGYELLSVVGPAVENYYERTEQGACRVYVKFKSAENATTMALVLVNERFDLADFDVPLITYADDAAVVAERKTGRIAVQIAEALEAQTLSSHGLKSIAPTGLSNWLKRDQFSVVQYAYRYEDAAPALKLKIRPLKSRLALETFVGLNVRPTAATYTYRLRYTISGSPVDVLTFGMDSRYAKLSVVQSPAMRSVAKRKADGLTMWDLSLINEVTGLVDVVVNFSVPLDANTKSLPMPPIVCDRLEEVRTIIAVQNMSRHEVTVDAQTNLSDLPFSAQQQLMPAAMLSSLQYASQTFESDWSLDLAFKPAKEATRVQAVVDLLAMTTVIDRRGRSCYEVKVQLQNRSEQFLRVRVPAGLRLWSAKVADQPVKPAVDADSESGEVLIPLVKTSPGGLPYEVSMYFAGIVVEPLNGLTRLSPPSISILDIPVMQTTWSLQLPKGYRYFRPGGNVSRKAGKAELMSLGIDAILKQSKRLDQTFREIAGRSSRGGAIAQYNFEVLNKKAIGKMKAYENYLARNPDLISGEEVQRLQQKYSEQQAWQTQIVGGNTLYNRRQEELNRNDVNFHLNAAASNSGMYETTRNKAILSKPEFVTTNEYKQIERLKKEIETSQQQKDQLVRFNVDGPAKDGKINLVTLPKRSVNELLVQSQEKNADVDMLVNQLSIDNTAQIDVNISQVQGQLEGLYDNRSQRYFKGQKITQTRQEADYVNKLDTGDLKQNIRSRQTRQTAQPQQRGDVSMGSYGGAYAAGSVYSLPVSLPGGGLSLDFARPSGDAELTIWAIPDKAVTGTLNTLIVIVISIVAALAIRVWPRNLKPAAFKLPYAIIYAVLLVGLTIIFTVAGLIAAAMIIAGIELSRARLARRCEI